jgi:PD-(D/E)XK nuclease superfamily
MSGHFSTELRRRGIRVLAQERLANEHIAQCLNYLRASGRTLSPLVNFQKHYTGSIEFLEN